MSEKADGKVDAAADAAAGTAAEVERLTNSLRFEKAKNEVLLGEVIALEDEVVNRCMADFDAVVIPGGWAPDKLRRDPHVLKLVCDFHEADKPIAAICHGGWVLASAGVYDGVRVTGSPGIKDDLVNAGAKWEDASVVVDGHFISSRKPDDLPDFCAALIAMLEG